MTRRTRFCLAEALVERDSLKRRGMVADFGVALLRKVDAYYEEDSENEFEITQKTK